MPISVPNTDGASRVAVAGGYVTEKGNKAYHSRKKPKGFAKKLTISKDRTEESGFISEGLALSVKPRSVRFTEQLETISRLHNTTQKRLWIVEWITSHNFKNSAPPADNSDFPIPIDAYQAPTDDIDSMESPPRRVDDENSEDLGIKSLQSPPSPIVEIRIANAAPSDGKARAEVDDQSVTLLLHLPRHTRMGLASASGKAHDESGYFRNVFEQDAVSNILEEAAEESSTPNAEDDHDVTSHHQPSRAFTTLYRDRKNRIYSCPPEWMVQDSQRYLSFDDPVDLESYIEENNQIFFIIMKDYDYDGQTKVPTVPVSSSESILFTSFELVDALNKFTGKFPGFDSEFASFMIDNEVHAPYLFAYYLWPELESKRLELDEKDDRLLSVLFSYINEFYGTEYDDAAQHIARGVVCGRHLKYLVRTGSLLVRNSRRGPPSAFEVMNDIRSEGEQTIFDDIYDDNREIHRDGETAHFYSVFGWRLTFDGKFHRETMTLDIRMFGEAPVPISNLDFYPLKYAPERVKNILCRRGTIFWQCRNRCLVSYKAPGALEPHTEDRFMVDYKMYQKIHGDDRILPRIRAESVITPAMMVKDTPPEGNWIYLFPSKTVGFSLRQKNWVDILVDCLESVAWNKRAFDNLVIEPDIKVLVRALITSRIKSDEGTDLIRGKGNGLILLLHGSPGTGKTFTAESVAEMAEKPLYRVTCGDIGTDPEEAEKYLESVLELGTVWDCVVLLDEADVFLEERSLTDLARNALVSGILILTSNRVGTFDQAFKSRIQLALHYPALTKAQRRKIWRNFINRLKDISSESNSLSVDFDDLADHLDELASEDMNGREIRNAITTARQFAKFEEKELGYEQLKYVIGVAGKFESYIRGLNFGRTFEQVAREDGLR
ncbi:uncharacterized protein K460DRAFT_364126 [Cucurbitaria berberidis CBS 394.84]|uniref:AAA+ ATPase domain-containing protein n=1 Tax=Cucurbitaria berberidis CBS 394.84 TaxID=1168544 RepID=A0A9P4GKS0_9PLEO|nr:uncharacterized protein K460DRAFT_364126 [Cucurbitaria berberidis CBS 394.84]KAF1848143.1 hypothetical protein K460DRAFT_364126 [Cucurbitaria berberidis CBS 394.84]